MKNKYNYKAVYCGRKLCGDGKVYQRFLRTDNNKEMHFQGVKRVWIGYTYKCGAGSISTKPERTLDERFDNAEWEATDTLVDVHNSNRRAEKKLQEKVAPTLKAAIEALKPLFKDKGYFERKAIIEWLAEKSSKNG